MCNVISLYFMCFSVNGSVCEAIRNFFGVVLILLLNVVDVFSVCRGALFHKPCIVFQMMSVLCL